jgi:hypothetical protein
LIQTAGSSEDGRLKPENNVAENAIRPFVMEFAIHSDAAFDRGLIENHALIHPI